MMRIKISNVAFFQFCLQGFYYFSEVGARGLLNFGKKHLDHQNRENLMQNSILNNLAV